MSHLDSLRQTFSEALAISPDQVTDTLTFNTIPQWDSVAAIETAFDIMLDTDDVIDMSSFAKAKEIVRKYGVAL